MFLAVAKAANEAGIALRALSPMQSGNPPLSDLMLVFGGFTGDQLRDAVRKLCEVVDSCGRGHNLQPLAVQLAPYRIAPSLDDCSANDN